MNECVSTYTYSFKMKLPALEIEYKIILCILFFNLCSMTNHRQYPEVGCTGSFILQGPTRCLHASGQHWLVQVPVCPAGSSADTLTSSSAAGEVTEGHSPDITLKYSHTVVNGRETRSHSHSVAMPTPGGSTETIHSRGVRPVRVHRTVVIFSSMLCFLWSPSYYFLNVANMNEKKMY